MIEVQHDEYKDKVAKKTLIKSETCTRLTITGENTPLLLSTGETMTLKQMQDEIQSKGSIELLGIDANCNYRTTSVTKIEKDLSKKSQFTVLTEKKRRITVPQDYEVLTYSNDRVVPQPVSSLVQNDEIIIPRHIEIQSLNQYLNLYELVPNSYPEKS